jgi:hypothetical protein
MASRCPSPLVQLDVSNLLCNLIVSKTNIQMQKTGAEGWFVALNTSQLLTWSVAQISGLADGCAKLSHQRPVD